MQEAVDYLNRHLFDAALTDAFLVFQRGAHSHGHFAPDRYVHPGAKDNHQHEVNLNPDHFVGKSDEEIVAVLAHEMTHLWQHVCDKPVKTGYHDATWGRENEGDRPLSVEHRGAGRQGDRPSDAVLHRGGGEFVKVFAGLAATGWRLDLESAGRPGKHSKPDSKVKYTCPSCGSNAWGKPDLATACIPCGKRMVPPESAAKPPASAGVGVQPSQPI